MSGFWVPVVVLRSSGERVIEVKLDDVAVGLEPHLDVTLAEQLDKPGAHLLHRPPWMNLNAAHTETPR